MIDEGKRKVLEEGLGILLSLQRRYQAEHGFDFWKQGPGKRREMFLRTLFAAISELSEAGDEVNKWWKKGSREPDSIVRKRDELLEEMIDALHFFLSCMIILEADGKEVAETYLRKLSVNFDRQRKKGLGYV